MMDKILYGMQILFWSIAIFFYNFQTPFMNQAWLITAGLAGYMLMNFPNVISFLSDNRKITIGYVVFFVFCLCSLLLAHMHEVTLSNSMRFLLILLLIPICPYFAKPDKKIYYQIFCAFTLSKAVFLIILAVLVLQAGSYAELRAWAQLNQYGDIYTMEGIMPHVQLKGNALIVIAFMLSFYHKKRFTLYNIILLLGVIFAGNFSFYLGIALFFCWMFLHGLNIRRVHLMQGLAGVLLLFFLTGFSQYALWQADEKGGSPDSSNGIRIQQYEILTDTNILYGSGLGALVKDAAKMGRPMDSQYYELQPLYIYYQIGLPAICIFYALMLLTMYRKCSYDGCVLFLIYLVYAFFNPYCMDTTQMIAMIMLAAEFPKKGNDIQNIDMERKREILIGGR